MTLTIDVISDVICPWCYIGKRRLENGKVTLSGAQQPDAFLEAFNQALPVK